MHSSDAALQQKCDEVVQFGRKHQFPSTNSWHPSTWHQPQKSTCDAVRQLLETHEAPLSSSGLRMQSFAT